MADKAGAGDSSSIFESLFGGFSNGLSIFTNNPFRRKHEVAVAKVGAEADSKKIRTDGSEHGKAEDAGEKEAEETGTDVSSRKTPADSEIASKSQRKQKHSNDGKAYTVSEVQGEGEIDDSRMKKAKIDEDDSGPKKKRSRMEVVDENADQDVNVRSLGTGSADGRKRKQETSTTSVEESAKFEVDEAGNVEDKYSKKKKKKDRKGDGDTPTEPVKRQSERNQKKRPKEQITGGQESAVHCESNSGKKAKKIGNGVQEGGDKEGDTTVKVKRSLDMEVVEKRKKKMKLVNELNESSPRVSDIEETAKKCEEKSSETKTRSKRRTEDDLESQYEKKLRGSTDSKEDGGVPDIDAYCSPKDKRKVVDDEEDDNYLGGRGKKRRLTKQQKLDNEARLRRTIFVGNVPVNVKAKNLRTEFSQFGAVESARLRSVPLVDIKMPRKAAVITGNLNENRTSLNGYVVFKEEASAKAALAYNMKEFRGKHLRVDLAGSGSSGIEYDRKRSIFVGSLPFDVEDEDMITLFRGNTPELDVEAVRVVRDPQTSAGKGFAFVCFKTKAGAQAALDKKDFIMFKNRHLRLERFGYKATPVKTQVTRATGEGKNPKPSSGAERRISDKRIPVPYEGERAGKRQSVTVKSRERGGSSTPNKTGRRAGLPKRPAVAAKKAKTLQMKAGIKSGPKITGGKRKREGKEKKRTGSKGKMKK